MNEEMLQLNETQMKMVKQLQDSIELQQHQLNAAIAMALAGADLSNVNVLRIESDKIFYNPRVLAPAIEQQPLPTEPME